MIAEEMTYTGQLRIANKALFEAKKIEKQKGLRPYYFRHYFISTSQHDMSMIFFFPKGLIKYEIVNLMLKKTYSGEIKLR